MGRGSYFDETKTYTAAILLNNGGGEPLEMETPAEERLKLTPIEESILIKVEDCYANGARPMPGEDADIMAVTIPEDIEVEWSITKFTPDCAEYPVEVEITAQEAKQCTILVGETSGSGYVTIRATDKKNSAFFVEEEVPVGCPSCTDCQKAGGGFAGLSSVNARFSLGSTEGGLAAGHIFLREDSLTAATATPAALVASTLTDGLERIYNNYGLRQVLSDQALADVYVVDDDTCEIRFYRSEAVNGQDEDGLYQIASGAAPFVTWRLDGGAGSLTLTELRDGQSRVYEYTNNGNAWSLDRGDGLAITTRTTAVDPDTGDRVVTETVKDAGNAVARTMQSTWHAFAWGDEVVRSVSDPDGAALATCYEYYGDAGHAGRVKKITSPDGSWTAYTYDAAGRIASTSTPWLDSGVRTITYDYQPASTEDSASPDHANDPRTIVETIDGQAVAVTYHVYVSGIDAETGITEQGLYPGSAYGAAGNLRTTRVSHPSGLSRTSGRLISAAYPDGRLETHAYEYDGKAERHTVTHGTTAHPDGIAYKTTREITVTDALGRTMHQETRVYTGTDYILVDWTEYEYDINDHLVATTRSDGTRTDASWGCCNREWEQDTQGIERTYAYDALNRVTAMTKVGITGQPDVTDQPSITTTYTYDAAGRQQSQTVTADTLSMTSSTSFDAAGRVISQTDASGLTTTYAYADGGRTTTVTRPTGTETTQRYLDGRIKSVTGTAVIPQHYTYGVNPDGTRWTEVHTGAPDSLLWERTTVDAPGRTITTEKPGFTGDIEITQNFYNDLGQLYKVTMPGQADTYYLYNALGEQVMTGLDVDGGGLNKNSIDRVTESETTYVEEGGLIWQQTVQSVYAVDNDDTPTVVGTQLSQLTGLGSGLVNRTETIDIHGNKTVSTTTIDRSAKKQTQTIDYPDSDTNAESVNINGLLVSSVSKTGLTYAYAYDALGRRTGVTDPRTGTAVTHYNGNHRVDYVQDAAGHQTSFAYGPATGQKTSETNADNKVTYYAYNDLGQVTRTWGEAVYPVEYVYDDYGRMTAMHTYRTGTAWNGNAWPAGEDPDVTAWAYDPATGLLTAKTDDQGNSVAYTYDQAGRLATRTWGRTDNGSPIVTSYVYDGATGELTGIDYSDDTTDIGFIYDRLGRQKTVSDAVGTRDYAYTDTLQLYTETITGLYVDDKVIARTYADTGLIGRNTGFTLGADYTMTYGYDGQGRFGTAGWNISGQNDTATYTYAADSDLLAGYSTTSGQSVAYGYEDHRNLKTSVENAFGVPVISNYTYQYDHLGRRKNVVNTGQAFAQAAFNLYNYNPRSELTGSDRYEGTDVTDLSTPVEPDKRLYQYDPIGNRQTATEGTSETAYEANSLNQYNKVGGSSLTYDKDGNLTHIPACSAGDPASSCVIPAQAGIQSTSGWNLTWNAENRLASVAPQTPTSGDTRVEFLYDYMGRRVKKSLFVFDGTDWTQTSAALFVYDGWNLIQELDGAQPTPTVQKAYAWGLDLSQSLQGAGGVGGLLAMTDGTSTYLYCYDGNGNVGQMVNATGGEIAAHYEYDPFGKIIASSGVMKDDNPFRLSTKYSDVETGLIHYTFRDYDPELGRWLSRDPISESGGVNTYGYINNNSIGNVDILGLWKKSVITGQSRQIYIRESTNDTFDTLAEIVKLESNEASKWAKVEQGNMSDPIDEEHPPCKVSVPNIWISADLLRGAGWHGLNPWDRLVNIGGTIGQAVGTGVFTSGDYKILKPTTPSGLETTIASNAGDIWGLVIFAHGNEYGDITDGAGDIWSHQIKILTSLDKNGYKIAKAYAMQCYSSNESTIEVGASWEANKYRNFGFTTVDTGTPKAPGPWEVDVRWKTEWEKRAVYFKGYKGMNVLGFNFGGD